MLRLKDFNHLPQLDGLYEEIAQTREGVVVVAGLEPRRQAAETGRHKPDSLDGGLFRSGGRSTIFGMLAREMLSSLRGRALVIAESKDSVRLSPRWRDQVQYVFTSGGSDYALEAERALARGPRLLLVDRLTAETAPFAFKAASLGIPVLAQLEFISGGREAAQHLVEMGLEAHSLARLRWILAVSRVRTLCENCRQPDPLDSPSVRLLLEQHPGIAENATFYREGACEVCRFTGRRGETTAFDVFRASSEPGKPFQGEHLLPMPDYLLGLAAMGLVAADDVLNLASRQLQSTFQMLTAEEAALAKANSSLNAKVAELEAANRVLRKQTQAAISLQDLSRALISYTNLEDLGDYVCRKAGELCGADCAVLYLQRHDNSAEILSVRGWSPAAVERGLPAGAVLEAGGTREEWLSGEPLPFLGWPPGIKRQEPDISGLRIRAGLRVPLVVQNEPVGLLIFNTTVKSSWLPREVALLKSFANSSALAIQRARLVDSLHEKIEQLTAAQQEIAKKERLERELELARQVQESMLPRIFPLIPGLRFAARNRAARQVGGDFYDVFPLDGSRCGLVVADVSDKGMAAALFMALTRSLILAEARREDSPYVVLERVHKLLRELSQSDQFVTVFYGVLDASAKSLIYVRAGHEPPLLLRDGSTLRLGGRGTIIGALDVDEVVLTEEHCELQQGDRLILFTDGLLDSLSPTNQTFGLERFVSLLNECRDLPLEQLCNAAFDAVSDHQGETEQFDDMTLLAVEVN